MRKRRTPRKFRSSKAGYHIHHIIPIHMGGTDTIDNIIELSITDHAEAHRVLYEQYQNWEDYLAWKTLSGQITHLEATKLAQSLGPKNRSKESWDIATKKAIETNKKKGYRPSWNAGLTKDDHPALRDASERGKLHMKEGRIHCIGDHHRGNNFSDDHKKNLSTAAKNRSKVTCEHCDKEVIPQMYTRWHGENCKSRRG